MVAGSTFDGAFAGTAAVVAVAVVVEPLDGDVAADEIPAAPTATPALTATVAAIFWKREGTNITASQLSPSPLDAGTYRTLTDADGETVREHAELGESETGAHRDHPGRRLKRRYQARDAAQGRAPADAATLARIAPQTGMLEISTRSLRLHE